MRKVKFTRYGCAFVCSFFAILFLASVAQAADVTDSIQVNSSRSFYNRRTGEFSFDATLKNISSNNFPAPLMAVITNLSSAQVTVSNPDGTDSNGNPYFDYSGLLGDDDVLSAGEISGAKKWIFHNPRNLRFTYDVQIIAGAGDDVPPSISITHPVDQSVISNGLPFITIKFSDAESGINAGSFSAQINSVDSTGLFNVTDTGATCQVTTPLDGGNHVISASISDTSGNTSTAQSSFTVSTSSEPIRYIFSLSDNDWVFGSPGDGTCIGYLNKDDLGLADFSDVVALGRVLPGGNLYFSLNDQGGIRQSPADGTNSIYLNNSQLGLGTSDQITASHIGLNGSAYFKIGAQPDILKSDGSNTNIYYMQNSQLGIADSDQIGCLHIGYDNTVYFCVSTTQNILQSPGDGTNSGFLTATALGVPGSSLDAFAFLPETVPPTMSITHPLDGSTINTLSPNFSISFSDADSGIDPSSFAAEINGADSTSLFTVTSAGANYQVTTPLPQGDNSITATISDNVGNQADATSNFTVEVYQATASATPTKGGIPLDVQFSAEILGGVAPYTYEWDLDGDGVSDDTRQAFTHVYQTCGIYVVTLTVNDSGGNSISDNVTIYALSAPTVIASASPTSGGAPLDVSFSATVSDPDGTIALYEWDFEGDGTYDYSSGSSPSTTYTYSSSGLYQAALQVTDNDGLSDISVISISVGLPPSASASASPMNGPAALDVNFTGSGSDSDGTVTLYEWDFDGDGTYDWSSTTSGDTMHTYNSAGIFNATFRVTDNDGLIDKDSILISVSGPPISMPGAFPVSGEAPLTVTFFSNGEDLDGSPEYYDWDFDGDGTNDTHLIASMNTTYTYTQAGTYNSALTVTDNEGLTGTASVTITVAAPPSLPGYPTAIAEAMPTNGGAPLQVALTGKGVDEGGTITKIEWDFESDGVFDFEDMVITRSTLGNIFDVGSYSSPDFVDIDNDGDFDLFIGESGGRICVYNNDGDSGIPSWQLIVQYLGYVGVNNHSAPGLVDIDNDGDLDLFIGEYYGQISFYRNDGDANAPMWTAVGFIADSAGSTIDVGSYSTPDFVDIDNDGDFDLFIGESGGRISFHRNDGDASAPVWTAVGFITDSAGSTIDVGSRSTPDLVDIDNDGDFDLFIGESGGHISFYHNDGDKSAPRWTAVGYFTDSSSIPIYVGSNIKPDFVDIDGDGDLDIISGNSSGYIYLHPTAGFVKHNYTIPGSYEATVRVTDNDNQTATDSITITVLDSGAPTATASANPTSGEVPLAVFFNGAGIDVDGDIALYEWDFDGDGTYDWSSSSSGNTSYTYDQVGSYAATLRVTDNEGKTSTDSINISASLGISASGTTIFDPVSGSTGSITSNLTGNSIVTVNVIDQSGNVVRPLAVNESRTAGTYTDTWDGKDDTGNIVRDGVYYFLFEHTENGETQTFDLRETGLYREYTPGRTWPSTFNPYEEDYVQVTYSVPYPSEVSMYFWKRDYTRPGSSIAPVRTMFLRKPKDTGSHTEIWDGIDDEGAVVGPWEGGYCITLWTYELPSNAMIITGNTPIITDVQAEPNFFSPAYNPYGSTEPNYTAVSFNLSKSANVEVKVKNSDGFAVRSFNKSGCPAGANTIIWDGKDFDDKLVKDGSYSISLTAIDNDGNRSLPRYAAIIIHY